MTHTFIHRSLSLLPLLLAPFLLLLPPGAAQEESSERILWIETSHKGPFVANSSVVFSCIHKLPFAQLSWSFLLSSSNSSIPALIDSSLDDFSVGSNRTSSIRIPNEDVSSISCVWSNVGGENKTSTTTTSLPIEVIGLPPKDAKGAESFDLCGHEGPQIFSITKSCGGEPSYERVTGMEISVNNTSSEGLALECFQAGGEQKRLQWSLVTEMKPSPTVVLNYLALINWKMQQRLESMDSLDNNTRCVGNSSQSFFRKKEKVLRCNSSSAGHLEIFLAPEKSVVTSVFKCSSVKGGGEASVTLKTLPVEKMEPKLSPPDMKDENKEFIELVNILMQILQSSESSSGGSGSGPLYGMGFGSTTIIALMAIVIYYLKRQIKQLQEEVELRDRRRRKSRHSNAHDDEDEEDDL